MNGQRICEGFDGGGRGSTLIKIFASVLHTLNVYSERKKMRFGARGKVGAFA